MRAKESKLPWGELRLLLDELENACTRMNADEIRCVLQKIVVEYGPMCEIVDAVWIGKCKAPQLAWLQSNVAEDRSEHGSGVLVANILVGQSIVEVC